MAFAIEPVARAVGRDIARRFFERRITPLDKNPPVTQETVAALLALAFKEGYDYAIKQQEGK